MAHLNRRILTAAMMGVSVTAVLAGCSSSNDAAPTSTTSTSESVAAPTSESAGERPYADGEYRADGEYGTQDSSIGVSLTLDDGVITDVDVDPHATDETSLDYQERFAAAVPELVEGKRIDEVELDRVAGSSGTPDGFNDALAKIRDEASR
ncbi:hypothetical protein [Streptomyces sp. BpilaLS-43]|uniref:hypothetical protein n=1 Tax=unclassified Streptomyces TaxID=2593676 RepID=UPI00081B0095|nr:hypothetical protein [Streptomyces sp. BpilaLS-43]SCD80706.1 hypothetical protein GA0115239_108722 [Streptomyces sp. BpilaLS-43]